MVGAVSVEGANIERLADARRKRLKRGTAGGGPSSDLLILDPKYPEAIAGKFLDARHLDDQGRRLLHHQSGVFYCYDGTTYRPVEEAQLEAAIYEFVRPAWRPTRDGVEPFDTDQRKVRDIPHALRALVHVPADIAAPAWLGEAPPDLAPEDVLVCRNTLLHLPTMSRLHTPDFFTLNALDFDFDSVATCPRWLRFLPQVADTDTIEQLAQMFGYVALTADTRQQKNLPIDRPAALRQGCSGSRPSACRVIRYPVLGAGRTCPVARRRPLRAAARFRRPVGALGGPIEPDQRIPAHAMRDRARRRGGPRRPLLRLRSGAPSRE
jgi:hypothetical protein